MDPKKIAQQLTVLNWSSFQGNYHPISGRVQLISTAGLTQLASRGRKIHWNYTGGTFGGSIRATLPKAHKNYQHTLLINKRDHHEK
jgi:hypothetical protein